MKEYIKIKENGVIIDERFMKKEDIALLKRYKPRKNIFN